MISLIITSNLEHKRYHTCSDTLDNTQALQTRQEAYVNAQPKIMCEVSWHNILLHIWYVSPACLEPQQAPALYLPKCWKNVQMNR